MSGRVCSYCGHGELDGLGWMWSDAGRLEHEWPDTQQPDGRDTTCRDVAGGIADGLVECRWDHHVVQPGEAVLAEMRYTPNPRIEGDMQGDIVARTLGQVPYVEQLEQAPEDGIPWLDGTLYVAVRRDRQGLPYLVCKPCALGLIEAAGHVGTRHPWHGIGPKSLRVYTGGAKTRSERPQRPRSDAPTVQREDDAARRREAVRVSLSDGPRTVAEIAAATGSNEKTVQRDLKALGAVQSRDGKNVRWSLSPVVSSVDETQDEDTSVATP